MIFMTTIRVLEAQLRAVANARRLGILAYVKKNQSVTVGEIADAVRLKRPSASQHLRILTSAGMLQYTKRGLCITYRLSLNYEAPITKILTCV